MKKIIIGLAIAFNTNIMAFEASTEVIASTLAETIYTTALTIATTETTVLSTDQKRLIANKIQNEIIEFYQTNQMGLILNDRIEFIKKSNPKLSNDQAIDVLIEITDKTLN